MVSALATRQHDHIPLSTFDATSDQEKYIAEQGTMNLYSTSRVCRSNWLAIFSRCVTSQTAKNGLVTSNSNVDTPKRIPWFYNRRHSLHTDAASSLTFFPSLPSVPLFQLLHPSTPVLIGWIDDPSIQHAVLDDDHPVSLELMNRNARRGKRANKGKRACSRQRRRSKRRAFGNHRR